MIKAKVKKKNCAMFLTQLKMWVHTQQQVTRRWSHRISNNFSPEEKNGGRASLKLGKRKPGGEHDALR